MKIICPKCKGKGYVTDWMSIILTGGITLLYSLADKEIRTETCQRCKGNKKIYND